MNLKSIAHIKLNPTKAFNFREEEHLEKIYGNQWRSWQWAFVEFLDSDSVVVEAHGVVLCVNTLGIEFELEEKSNE